MVDIDEDLLIYTIKSLRKEKFHNTFICPLCKRSFPIDEADIYIKKTSTKLISSHSYVNTIIQKYRITYHNIRVCRECTKRTNRVDNTLFGLWIASLVVFLLFTIIREYLHFDAEECSIWGFIAIILYYFIIFFPASFIVYRIMDFISGFLFNTMRKEISFDEANETNAIASPNDDGKALWHTRIHFFVKKLLD